MALYCTTCGKLLGEDARFCSACGRALAGQATFQGYRLGLVRPRNGRMIAGICQGLAHANGWDVTLVRVLAVALGLMTFPFGFMAYFVFWVIIPEEQFVLPSTTPPPNPAA